MREKIIYIVSFLLAFVLVSGMIIYLNSVYSNIFAFEFTPINSQFSTTEVKPANSVQNSFPNPNEQVNPISLSLKDTSNKNVDSSKIKTVSITPSDTAAIAKVQHSLDEQKKRDIERNNQLREDSLKLNSESRMNAKKDSVYQIWVRKTVNYNLT